MKALNRKERFKKLFPDEPQYRLEQVNQALFSDAKNWDEVSALPSSLRLGLEKEIPWLSVEAKQLVWNSRQDTCKALLTANDGLIFETVLMKNKREQWTICVSSQVGCAMACTFCATGTMGLKRSLISDEIVDQYRFWKQYLREHPELPQRISNVVFMGMGEPTANYESVKEALHTWLKYTDLGLTRITVSTVGILPVLKKILEDPEWPSVRIAISLHSANQKRREEIVPTTVPHFLEKLKTWSHDYAKKLGNRRHHITYEYTLLNEVNDSEELAHELAKYIRGTASSKINVIPYNPVSGKSFHRSQQERTDRFKEVLRGYDLTVTQRKTMGDDIAAACGQLVVINS